MKQTEQRIKFAEVEFPSHVSPACRSFIKQVPKREGWAVGCRGVGVWVCLGGAKGGRLGKGAGSSPAELWRQGRTRQHAIDSSLKAGAAATLP